MLMNVHDIIGKDQWQSDPHNFMQIMLRGITGHSLALLDTSGLIIAVNREAEHALQWPASELFGCSHAIFYPPDELACGQPDADLEAAKRLGAVERDAWRVCADGSEYLARLTINPVLNTKGETVGFSCIARDITEEVALRRSSEKREQHLQSILATIPDAMIVIDESGSIISFSAAAERLFGYSEATLVGRNISCLMPEPDRSRHDGYMAQYLKTGEKRIIGIGRIVVGQRQDGTTFPLQLSVGEAGEQGSRIFTGFIRDLTAKERDELKLKELQAELVHVSRLSAMGTMASTLAHELNQPLTAVANYLETARDYLTGNARLPRNVLQDVLNEAAEETIRAGFIVRRLRDFVARGEVDKSIEDLPELIEDASKLALIGARECGVRSFINCAPLATPVLVDRVQIQQVIVNLVRNAIEAMSDARVRELRVATRLRTDGFIEVSVEDTGPGIPEEILPRLFKAFVSSKTEGMGLGLSICRTIVEAHGGRIWVEQRQDGGSIFRFTLIHAQVEDANEH